MLSPIIERLTQGVFEKVHVDILRLDLLHPSYGGNKYFKLKYNLKEAMKLKKQTLLTFGGAYSNHLLATAVAGAENGFKTVGIVRGEEPTKYSPTLLDAKNEGMQLEFWQRGKYKMKDDFETLMELEERFGDHYLIPEGGSNRLAVKGTSEILKDLEENYTHICVSAGTGGTAAGLLISLKEGQQLWVFPALKGGEFLNDAILKLAHSYLSTSFERDNMESQLKLFTDYHFGGYAKYDQELIDYITSFYNTHKIPLDFVYTGKLIYGVQDQIKLGAIKREDKVLVIHTGGLQGNRGVKQLNFNHSLIPNS